MFKYFNAKEEDCLCEGGGNNVESWDSLLLRETVR